MDEYKKYKLKKLKEDARLGFFCFFAYPIIFYVLMLLLPILIDVLGSDTFSNFPFIIIRGMMWLIFGLASLFIFPFGFYIWVISISNICDFLKAKYIKNKMTKTEKYWVKALIVLLVVGFFYGMVVYNSFFKVQHGFIYDPATDRLFYVELKPSFDKNDKWSLLIPFNNPYFGDIGYADYLGKFIPLLKEIEADKKLSIHDPIAWEKKIENDLKTLVDDIRSKGLNLWDIDYFPRHDLDSKILIPDQLSFLKQYLDNTTNDVIAADVMVVSFEISARDSTSKDENYEAKAPITELIRKVLLIRGRAAYKLIELGFIYD